MVVTTPGMFRADLMTEIEALEDQGFSLEEIVRQKGAPELVAKEFNDSSSDPEAQRQYYLQRGLKIAVIVLLVSAVLLVLAGTALHYLPFWYTPPLTEPMAPPPFSSPVFPKSRVLPPSC